MRATYLLALNFCTLLPGPEAMQLATYAGWRLHGTRGGLAAGLLFVAPGALVILVLAALYASFGNVPVVVAVFTGIKAAVLAIVIEALIRIARRSLAGRVEWMIAAAVVRGHFLFPRAVSAHRSRLPGYSATGAMRSRIESAAASPVPAPAVPLASTARTIAIWLADLDAAAAGGGDRRSGSITCSANWPLFFSKLAVVTFGGAYAVLAYMAQEVVEGYGWLKPGEMLDGLGLAETTPGPLILVTEFVGFLAAARHGGEPSLLFGVLGAVVTLWATFAPCFLWVFVGAPYIERLTSAPRLKSALSAITAAVVGVDRQPVALVRAARTFRERVRGRLPGRSISCLTSRASI